MIIRRPAWLRCIIAVSLLAGAAGCTRLGLLTLNTAAAFGDYSRTSDIAYDSGGQHRLDLYRPARGQDCPLVVYFYGGAWDGGDKASFRFVGAALAEAGVVAVIPNYARYPEARFPRFMHDAALAVAYARAHAREWGADPDRLFVIGHSAGAHMAVLLALDQEYLQQVDGNSRWLRGAVGLAGPYDFLPAKEAYLNEMFGPPENFARSQPVNFARADAPPLLLMHGLRDQRVDPDNTRKLEARMQAVGGSVRAEYFPQAAHADLVAAFSPLRPGLPVLPEILSFLRR